MPSKQYQSKGSHKRKQLPQEKHKYWLVTFTNNSKKRFNLQNKIEEIYNRNKIPFKELNQTSSNQFDNSTKNEYQVVMERRSSKEKNDKKLNKIKRSIPKSLECEVAIFSCPSPYLGNNSPSEPNPYQAILDTL